MTQDLFDNDDNPMNDVAVSSVDSDPTCDDALRPLADRMRPKTIDEVVGQKKLIGPGQPLRVAFDTARQL